MKRLLSYALAALMLFAVLPAGAGGLKADSISTITTIDADGSDGYSGDYVVIYNPATQVSNVRSTGDMTGLIKTSVEPYTWKQPMDAAAAREAERLGRRKDVDGMFAEEARRLGVKKPDMTQETKEPLSFEVGDVHTFYVYWYSPLPMRNIEFKVLAKGEHCYIWTPTSDDPNVWPLDSLDESYAQTAADVFDSKFDLMQYSFGEQYNGALGDGRLNLLFYNIDDGWYVGSPYSYIGGYFFSYDYVYNEMPIVNIDTWPTIRYTYADGSVTEDIAYIYNVMVHEYQHLINYSQCGETDNMVNEMMSAAAEEICFPGSSAVGRIWSWTNYYEMGGYDFMNPPEEVEYVPEYPIENGFSLFDWDADTVDILVLYAQVSLFSQYLYTHYGNGFFHDLMDELADGWPTVMALENASGKDATMLAEDFRVALTANTALDEYEGKYAFKPQEGYDPEEYYGIESPYDLLCPVVFTGRQCDIAGAGAICVKPVGGVYYPPRDADPSLKYFGITRTTKPKPISVISVEPEAITLTVGGSTEIAALPEPLNAAGYSIVWASSEEEVAEVAGEGLTAVVTGVSPGTAFVSVTASDEATGRSVSAEVMVTVVDRLPGDVDSSGSITANDALMVLRASLGLITLTPEQEAAADVDGSGSITANDALMILRISLGLITI